MYFMMMMILRMYTFLSIAQTPKRYFLVILDMDVIVGCVLIGGDGKYRVI